METSLHILIEQTIIQVTADLSCLDIAELLKSWPADIEEAAGEFCDRFELGSWFYEQLVAYEIDIAALLEVEYEEARQAQLVEMEAMV